MLTCSQNTFLNLPIERGNNPERKTPVFPTKNKCEMSHLFFKANGKKKCDFLALF